MGKRASGGTPALVALQNAGIPHTVHAYEHDPGQRNFGLEAAEALGLPAQCVFKTLVVLADASLVVAVVPVSGSLDLKALAAAAGASKAQMAPVDVAERTTGYVAGGVSPVGQRKALPTYVDESAILQARIYVSGGKRGLDIGIAPDDLVAITNGVYAPIARD